MPRPPWITLFLREGPLPSGSTPAGPRASCCVVVPAALSADRVSLEDSSSPGGVQNQYPRPHGNLLSWWPVDGQLEP